jgi:hypothetical protein
MVAGTRGTPLPSLASCGVSLKGLTRRREDGWSTLVMRSTLLPKRWNTNGANAPCTLQSILRPSIHISKKSTPTFRPAADRSTCLTLQGQELPRRSPQASWPVMWEVSTRNRCTSLGQPTAGPAVPGLHLISRTWYRGSEMLSKPCSIILWVPRCLVIYKVW